METEFLTTKMFKIKITTEAIIPKIERIMKSFEYINVPIKTNIKYKHTRLISIPIALTTLSIYLRSYLKTYSLSVVSVAILLICAGN